MRQALCSQRRDTNIAAERAEMTGFSPLVRRRRQSPDLNLGLLI